MVPRLSLVPPPALRVVRRDPAALSAAEIAAWRGLSRRSLEPSVFADPDMVLPLLQHRVPRRDAFVLLVWGRSADGRERLRGALALRRERRLRLGKPAVRALLVACGLPLVAAPEAVPVLSVMLADLATPGGTPHVAFPDLEPGGPLRAALDAAAQASGCAVLPPLASPTARPAAGGQGAEEPCTLRHRSDPVGVRDGIERFLALEAATAKDCLLDDPVGVTVFRVASRRLARRRMCRVSLSWQGETLVGAAVHLREGAGEVVWRRAGRIPAVSPVAARAECLVRVRGGGGLVARLSERLRA